MTAPPNPETTVLDRLADAVMATAEPGVVDALVASVAKLYARTQPDAGPAEAARQALADLRTAMDVAAAVRVVYDADVAVAALLAAAASTLPRWTVDPAMLPSCPGALWFRRPVPMPTGPDDDGRVELFGLTWAAATVRETGERAVMQTEWSRRHGGDSPALPWLTAKMTAGTSVFHDVHPVYRARFAMAAALGLMARQGLLAAAAAPTPTIRSERRIRETLGAVPAVLTVTVAPDVVPLGLGGDLTPYQAAEWVARGSWTGGVLGASSAPVWRLPVLK